MPRRPVAFRDSRWHYTSTLITIAGSTYLRAQIRHLDTIEDTREYTHHYALRRSNFSHRHDAVCSVSSSSRCRARQRLGGQQGAYIESALLAYRDGTCQHPTMRAHAASLTDQDIENLIAWITSSGDTRDTATAESAARVAPAATCIACHGADGEGVIPQPPTLAGQEADYLEYALHQYKDGTRSGTVMGAFTAGLSDADIAQLAKFYSSQDGLKILQQ